MTALTPISAKPPAKTASALTTPGLWRRLTDASVPWADAIRDLAQDPVARDELGIVVWDLERTIEPCGPAVVIDTLAPLLALYGVGRKSEAEAEAFWGFYLDALGSLPAEALRNGVAEYVADAKSEFFPKPGPLKAICERHAVPLRMAANRARKALEAQ
jgi:hypothetical protein